MIISDVLVSLAGHNVETYGNVAVQPRVWHWKQGKTMTVPTDPQLPLIWQSLGKSQVKHRINLLAFANLSCPCSLVLED